MIVGYVTGKGYVYCADCRDQEPYDIPVDHDSCPHCDDVCERCGRILRLTWIKAGKQARSRLTGYPVTFTCEPYLDAGRGWLADAVGHQGTEEKYFSPIEK